MPASRNPESIFGPYTRRAAGAARMAWAASAAYALFAVLAIVLLLG